VSPSPACAVNLSVDGPVVWSPNFGVTVAKELERRFPLFSSVLVCLLDVAVFPVLFPSLLHILPIIYSCAVNCFSMASKYETRVLFVFHILTFFCYNYQVQWPFQLDAGFISDIAPKCTFPEFGPEPCRFLGSLDLQGLEFRSVSDRLRAAR